MNKEQVNDILRDLGLPNVTDSAYLLEPEVTPNFSAQLVELPSTSGVQLRVFGSFIALEQVGTLAFEEQWAQHAESAVRKLMKRMQLEATTWLEAHPET